MSDTCVLRGRRAPLPVVLLATLAACTGSIGGTEQGAGNRPGTGKDPCDEAGANRDGCDLVNDLGDEVPAFVPLRRLNRVEYGIIMNELLGAPTNLGDAFEADGQTDGFDTVGQSLTISDVHARTHFRLAESAVETALAGARRNELMVCGEETADCARTIAGTFARRAWRRAIAPDELDDLVAVYSSMRDSQLTHEEAIAGMLEAVLNAPEFFFRMEENSNYSGPRPLTSNEMATRLSLFLWSSIPDEELLSLAESDQLQNETVLRQQVDRMLKSDKARRFVDNFGGQWLRTRELPAHSVSSSLFPQFTDAVRTSAKRETDEMFWDILQGTDPVDELILADWSYVDSNLAPLYQITGEKGFGARTELGEERGLGILSRIAFLTNSSMFDRTSVVRRGNRILSDVLCASPGPPADATLVLPPADPQENLSLRERLEMHRSNPECKGCHGQLDPLGFALENFDAIGRTRTKYEDGADVVTSGELPGFGPFDKGSDIGPAIAGDPRFQQCVARKLLVYGVGRDYLPADRNTLERISPSKPQEALGLREIVTRLVLSAAFRVRKDVP